MMRTNSAILVPLLLLVSAACAPTGVGEKASEEEEPAAYAMEVGQPFPNLVLPSLADGSPSSISQFRGKKLLLHIFASW